MKIKRAYSPVELEDGFRILIDRLWPRGVRKVKAKIGLWLKGIAPSTELRKWFNHDPKKWDEFQRRYRQELDKNTEVVGQIKQIIKKEKQVTLVYGAKDEEHNDAVVLLDYLR